MKKLLAALVLISVFLSCKEETSYQSQILFKNELSSSITVELFPKKDYNNGDWYLTNDGGDGYRDKIFVIESSIEQDIFTSRDVNIEPFELSAIVFDSIHITPFGEDKLTIRFSPNLVTGFTDNLFEKNSEWIYKIRNLNLRTNFNANPVESHDHIFVISEDKY